MGEKISMDKEYATRDGRPVRLLCVDRECDKYPIVIILENCVGTRTETGKVLFDQSFINEGDLIEVKPKHKREFWVNHYRIGNEFEVHNSKDSAERSRAIGCIATTHHVIEFTEGEGL